MIVVYLIRRNQERYSNVEHTRNWQIMESFTKKLNQTTLGKMSSRHSKCLSLLAPLSWVYGSIKLSAAAF